MFRRNLRQNLFAYTVLPKQMIQIPEGVVKLLKFIPGAFGRGLLFSTKTDVLTVPSTATISVNSSFADVVW